MSRALLIAYTIFLAPRASPRVEYRLLLSFGWANALVFATYALSVAAAINIACLMVPAMRSEQPAVPAWPFIAASFFVGAFALLPYLAVWTPPARPAKLPYGRRSKQLQPAVAKLPMRLAETNLLPTVVLVLALAVSAIAAGGGDAATRKHFASLAQQTSAVHMALVDLAITHAISALAMLTDARARNWESAQPRWLLALLAAVPVAGPATYLLLRPKTYGGWWPPMR